MSNFMSVADVHNRCRYKYKGHSITSQPWTNNTWTLRARLFVGQRVHHLHVKERNQTCLITNIVIETVTE